MAIIPQLELFSWEEIEPLGDLERLRLVLEHLPDEALKVQLLEKSRGHERDDYPVRAMWNSMLAGIVFQHPSIENLRRELSRNVQLRSICGLRAVPSADAYTRFFRRLMTHGSWIVHRSNVRRVDEGPGPRKAPECLSLTCFKTPLQDRKHLFLRHRAPDFMIVKSSQKVYGRHVIRIAGKTAVLTVKAVAASVSGIHVAAGRTRLAGVGRAYSLDFRTEFE